MPLSTRQRVEYVEDAGTFFDLMRRAHQWDGLTTNAVGRWLGNFPEESSLRYFASRILRGLLYYSESNVETLLREALFHKVIGGHVRVEHQLSRAFFSPPSLLQYHAKLRLERTLLVPLSVSSSPAASAPEITRIAEQRLGVDRRKICYPEQLPGMELKEFESIVFVDDNLGSGQQFSEFWTSFEMRPGVSPQQYFAEQRVPIVSLVLVGAEDTLTRLRKTYPNVVFSCAQELPSRYGVFAPDSVYWPDAEEQLEARTLLAEHLRRFGIDLLGYNDMTYAVILHKTIPDWCLPALWRQTEDWTPLLSRRNSWG